MKKLYCIFFLCLSLNYFATHIVGGEMIYTYIGTDNNGANQYRITLRIYRDCAPNNAAFDGTDPVIPALITVREGNGALTGVYNIGAPVVTRIPPTINSPCITTPNDVCVEEGVYTTTLSLPAKAGGYYIIYQRCCRNTSINNLINPGAAGSTYYTKIPGPEEVAINSSPRFTNFPPIFLCADLDFSFDHSATDPDGDQLVYSFYTPFLGEDNCCSYLGSPVPPTCPSPPLACPTEAPPPPYAMVNYAAPYSGTYPIAANPAFSINAVTGKLSGKPGLLGQFVVGVCVKEYRNGVLINTHYRDFQFNIRSCLQKTISNITQQNKVCDGSTVTFTNASTSSDGNATTALWDFGVSSLSSDTSVIFNPVYTFPDTGKYTVTLIANAHRPCADTSKKDVYIYPKLDVSYFPQANQCFNTNVFNFNVKDAYLAGTTYKWDFTAFATPSVSVLQNPPPVVFNKGGGFFVKLTAQYLTCRDSFVDSVRVIDRPPASSLHWDTTLVIGQPGPINAYAGAGFTYTWTPVTDYLNCSPCFVPNVISTTTTGITYTVALEDPMHCFITESTYRILIDVKASVDVPTAFTPNGDGTNDIIYVAGWGIKKLVYFKIFNRWGELLFQTDDIKTGWDGRFNSLPQNMETYVYQVAVETYVKENARLEKTGTFRLIR